MNDVSPSPAASTTGAGSSTVAGQTAPWAIRQINVTLTIGSGNTITIKSAPGAIVGPRVSASIETVTLPATGIINVRIWGMTLSDMNNAAKAGQVFNSGLLNTVTLQAGDAISGMTTIASGPIIQAYPDFKSQPDTSFFIQASSATISQLKPVPVTSFPGQTPAGTAFGALAKAAGLRLENNGVTAILQSPYFHGTAWSQILNAVRAVDCFAVVDGVNSVLAIWPKNGNRSGGPIQVNAGTGMIGYPSFQLNQLRVETLFNPNLGTATAPGNQIKVYAAATDASGTVTPLSAANGLFTIVGVQHDLSAQIPKGPWFSTILATPVGVAQ